MIRFLELLETARLRWDGHEEHPPQNHRLTEESLAVLCGRLSGEIGALVRDEIRLAKTDLQVKATLGLRAALLLGVAACIGMFALTALVATAILALSLVMPAWLSTLVVAVAGGFAASLFALAAVRAIRRAMPIVPPDSLVYAEQFGERISDTVAAIRYKADVPSRLRERVTSITRTPRRLLRVVKP